MGRHAAAEQPEERVDPAGAADPVDPADPADPVDPADAADPADPGERTPPARSSLLPLIALVVLVLAAVGLGIWWWSLGSKSDPVDAAPVDGYATVVSSPACDSGSGDTVVDLLGSTPAPRATVNACGMVAGQQIAVQYLGSDPRVARVAGTTTAGQPGVRRWLPLGILLIGVLAIGALIAMLRDRRRVRTAKAGRLSVAALQQVTSADADADTDADADADADAGPATGDSDGAGGSGRRARHARDDPAGNDSAADATHAAADDDAVQGISPADTARGVR